VPNESGGDHTAGNDTRFHVVGRSCVIHAFFVGV
jgi:hypothetical protein